MFCLTFFMIMPVHIIYGRRGKGRPANDHADEARHVPESGLRTVRVAGLGCVAVRLGYNWGARCVAGACGCAVCRLPAQCGLCIAVVVDTALCVRVPEATWVRGA